VLEPRGALTERDHVDRQQVERVHQQDQAEDGDRQRRNQRVGDMEAVLDLVVDELHHELRKALETAGRGAGATLCSACCEVEAEHEQETEAARDSQAVQMQGPERALSEVPVPIGQVMLDVLAYGPGVMCSFSSHHRSRCSMLFSASCWTVVRKVRA